MEASPTLLQQRNTAITYQNCTRVLPRTQTSLFKTCAQRKAGNGPLRFNTSHSRFALASTMRKTKRLRRRLMRVDFQPSRKV